MKVTPRTIGELRQARRELTERYKADWDALMRAERILVEGGDGHRPPLQARQGFHVEPNERKQTKES
jgi:hypothetical protein